MSMKREQLIERWDELKVENRMEAGRFRMERPGHTREVAYLESCHSGVITSKVYAAGMYLGLLSEEEGKEILCALETLQVQDERDEKYGCYRWYFEETGIADTNGAFFVTMPLLQLCVYSKEKIPESHWEILERMFLRSIVWFKKECQNPQNHYSNKILSDAAALSALAFLLNKEEEKQCAIDFCRQWDRYTRTRGWGWGENISPIYLEVILDALLVIGIVMEQMDEDVAKAMAEHYKQRVEYANFHGKYTFVPAIRSYNFAGTDENINEENGILHMACYKSGVDSDLEERAMKDDNPELWAVYVIAYMIYEGKCSVHNHGELAKIYEKLFTVELKKDGVVRKERVFDSAEAYTWKGEHVRLGSVNHYPVIPGCYQHPTWGLGWQSMPVSFLVKGAQMGYARFRVDDGEIIRTHPAYDHHSAYLSPALFKGTYLPAVRTNCAQKEQVCIAVRTLENVNNEVISISDEWVVHRFKNEMFFHGDWVCLRYPNCCVAMLPLGGYWAQGENVNDHSSEVFMEKDDLIIRKYLYLDTGKKRFIHDRLECGWVIVAMDGRKDMEEIKGELDTYEVKDCYLDDHVYPRIETRQIRNVQVYRKEELICEEVFDIHHGIRA